MKFIILTFILLNISCASKKSRTTSSIKSPRNLDFLNLNAKGHNLHMGEKFYKDRNDKIFKDGWGREAILRGWNFTNSSKDPNFDFVPTKPNEEKYPNCENAEAMLVHHRKLTGSNVARWLFSWEGVEKEQGVYDYRHLDRQICQLKHAIKMGMYVLVDFHQDTFSRHIKGGSNGTPKWVTDLMKEEEKILIKNPRKRFLNINRGCLKPCLSWAQNYFTNSGVRAALRYFFYDMPVPDGKGNKIGIQTFYVNAVVESLRYIKEKLTPEEFTYIIGLDPVNEPADGVWTLGPVKWAKGVKSFFRSMAFWKKGKRTKWDKLNNTVLVGKKNRDKFIKAWSNNQLYSLYERIYKEMLKIGWEEKFNFAEPHVFWNVRMTAAGVWRFLKASGGGHIKPLPYKNWVFNSHKYDETRQGLATHKYLYSGSYIHDYQEIRDEAKRLGQIPFVTEFGAWNIGQRLKVSDPPRMIKAHFQAMAASKTSGKKRSKKGMVYPDFYSPFISATQWVWSFDHHNWDKTLKNGESNRAFLSQNAVNMFSNSKDYEERDYLLVERGFPKRIQGDLISAYYNDLSEGSYVHQKGKDKGTRDKLRWAAIKPRSSNKVYFQNNKFLFAVWKANGATAPSEFFIPRHFDLEKTFVITHKNIFSGVNKMVPTGEENEIFYRDDINDDKFGQRDPGRNLFIYDDRPIGKDYRFAIIVEMNDKESASMDELKTLQSQIQEDLKREQQSLIFTTRFKID